MWGRGGVSEGIVDIVGNCEEEGEGLMMALWRRGGLVLLMSF